MKRFPIVLAIALILTFITAYATAQTTNANIDGITYKAIRYGDQSISIKAGDKTILHIKRADLYVTFEPFVSFAFKDFNGDGFPDLVINYNSNVPGKQDLILYDHRSKKFAQVSGFPEYPTSKRITNTSFYYSYRKSGCADMDWDSDLYKIANDKIILLGTIAGKGCQDDPANLGISIFKITGKKEHRINKLPIAELSKYNGNKLSFIDNYWKLNYSRF